MVEYSHDLNMPEGYRLIREGSTGSRFIQALLDGGRVGVDMGMAIIPGVCLICTIVLLLTNTTGASGVYDGPANQVIGLLP